MNAILHLKFLPSYNKLRQNYLKSERGVYSHWAEVLGEFLIRLVIFALFASAYPDRYRSLL